MAAFSQYRRLAKHVKAEREWVLRWTGLKKWFISRADAPSQADTLRSCARSAIPSLLIAFSGFHDRRVASNDRPTDLKLLARWFAQTESDADAHRLWRVAFGLKRAQSVSAPGGMHGPPFAKAFCRFFLPNTSRNSLEVPRRSR